MVQVIWIFISKPYFHDQVGLQFDKERQQEIAHFNKQTDSEESSKKRTRFPEDENLCFGFMWLEPVEYVRNLKHLLSSFFMNVSDDNDEKSISSKMDIMYGGLIY